MPADAPTPLCTADQFLSGPFGDLASQFQGPVLDQFLVEATRLCEDEAHRRLAPFTAIDETHRAEGIDPDEYADAANLPMSIQATLGNSYAQAVGAQDLVRHCWVNESAPRFQELWEYSNVSVQIIRSYGGTQNVTAAQILNGPEVNTGHLWFQLGTFLPIGSRIQVTYSGGYVVAIPASLVRACRYMCASLIVRELDPGATNHNPDQLHTDALLVLSNWARS